MSSEEFRIIYDNPRNMFYAGQTVSGKVELVLTEPKKIKGIIIQIKGEADVQWSQWDASTGIREVTYKGNEKIFFTEHYCIGGRDDDPFMLRSGNHSYQFSHQIPVTAPASFAGKHGKIHYSVKVVIVRPKKWNQDIEKAFQVISYYDLNRFPNLLKPAKATAEKYFCYWCCRNGPLTVAMMVPKTGYVSGERIPVTAEVDNTSNVNITETYLIFQKLTTYFSTTPQPRTQNQSDVLSEVKLGPVNAHSSKSFTHEFVVPSLKTTSLGHCSLIDTDYQIYLKAETGVGHTHLYSSAQIVIGNVPFNNQTASPMQNSDSETQPTKITSSQNESNNSTTQNGEQVSEHPLEHVISSSRPIME